MYELPLPKGGKVRHIIHLSDTHIRTGSVVNSRYEEYFEVIQKVCEDIQGVNNETVVVLTGDVFHHKNKLESSGLYLFT